MCKKANSKAVYTCYGTNPADGKGFSGESFAEYASYVGKRLISRDHFMAIAEGSNQRTAISSVDGIAGGHYDTAGRRMVSNCGCEDCCGYHWQWTSQLFDTGTTWFDSLDANKILCNAPTFRTGNKYIDIQLFWREECVWEAARTTKGNRPDSYLSAGRGVSYAELIRRLMVGAGNDPNECCGTRAIDAIHLSSCTRYGNISSRLVAIPYVG